MKAAARQTAPSQSNSRYVVYVMNIGNTIIRKYNIFSFFEPQDSLDFTAVHELVVEQDIYTEFLQLVQYVKDVSMTMETSTNIPGDVVGSAFDIVHNSYNMNQVTIYLMNNLTFNQTMAALVNIPASIVLNVFGEVNFVMPVTFADGSTALFKQKGLTAIIPNGLRFEFEYMTGSAKDADGNTIPENSGQAENFEGTFGSETAANTMTNYITSWYGASLGSWSCSSSFGGGKITVTCRKT